MSQPVAAIGLESPQQFGLPKRRGSTAGERQAAVFRETFHEPAKQGTQALVQQRRGPQLEVGPVIGQCTARGSNSPRSSQWICQRTLGCRKRCSPRGSGVGSWKDRFARPWKRLRRETTRVGCATEGSPGLFKQEKMTHRAAGSRSGMEHAAWGTFSGRVSSGMRSKNPGNRFNKESIPGGDGLAAAFGDELLRQGPAGTCLSGSFTSRVRPRSRSGPNRGRDGRRRVDRRARRSAGSWHTRSDRRR